MTQQGQAGASEQTQRPFDRNECLGLPKKQLGFHENLRVGEGQENRVQILLAREGFRPHGVKPPKNGKYENGEDVIWAKEQKDIVLSREALFIPQKPWADTHPKWAAKYITPSEWRKQLSTHNCYPIEVKSHSKRFTGLEDFKESTGQDFVTLDDRTPWEKKDPRPRTVVTISQQATDRELLEGKGLIVAVHDLSPGQSYTATVRGGKKEVVRFPLSACVSWETFIEYLDNEGLRYDTSIIPSLLQRPMLGL
jgi:hypothetical protein